MARRALPRAQGSGASCSTSYRELAVINAISLWGCVSALLFFLSVTGHAQSSRFIEYEYDAAGNVIRMTTTVINAPPVVTELTPSHIRLNRASSMTATGSHLLGATVQTDHPELNASNVSSTPSRVVFTLTTTATTPLGPHTLTFSTSLGSATATVEVIPDQPNLLVYPAPVAAPNTGAPVALIVELQTPDVVEHVLSLSIGNLGIANVSPSSVTIPVGQQRPTEVIQVTGLLDGVTTLTLQSPLLDTYRTLVFVAPPAALTAGNYSANARPLGVRRGALTVPSITLNPLASPLLGVVRQTNPTTTTIAPITAPLLGATRQPGQSTSNVSPLLAPLLGVQRTSGTSTGLAVGPLLAPQLGIQRTTGAPVGTAISPLVAPLLGVERTPP